MFNFLAEVDSSWLPLFERHTELLDQIFESLKGSDFTPDQENVFRAFSTPLQNVKVVIFGQDPYPGEGIADGLAFSSSANAPIPASLKNIFKEYSSDLGIQSPASPDLSLWQDQGVMLLNRSLTTVIGERNAHLQSGWHQFTLAAASLLAERDVIAILWGNFARELAPLFRFRIESAHPSPLSARLGFFGSRPFTETNRILRELGKPEINWKL